MDRYIDTSRCIDICNMYMYMCICTICIYTHKGGLPVLRQTAAAAHAQTPPALLLRTGGAADGEAGIARQEARRPGDSLGARVREDAYITYVCMFVYTCIDIYVNISIHTFVHMYSHNIGDSLGAGAGKGGGSARRGSTGGARLAGSRGPRGGRRLETKGGWAGGRGRGWRRRREGAANAIQHLSGICG